jgi:hypothetical protein
MKALILLVALVSLSGCATCDEYRGTCMVVESIIVTGLVLSCPHHHDMPMQAHPGKPYQPPVCSTNPAECT